jgi:hypothetical protein
MKFLEQFAAANRVSTPLVAVRTFDQKSTMDSVNKLYEKKESPAILWDAVNGFRPVNKTGKKALDSLLSEAQASPELTVALSEALRIAAMNKTEDTFFFMANIHLHWSDPVALQGIWNLRDPFKANGSMLILMTNSGAQLPPELVSDILVLDEPLPTEDELRTIIKDTYKYAELKEPDETTLRHAVEALIGLPAFPAEQATAMCLDTKTKTLDLKELWARKRQTINQTPGLSVWEGGGTLSDMGGLGAIKDFLRKICNGNEAPTTILFMDEIEKAYAGTGTDTSGTKTELTGRMLSWTQDKEIDGMIWIGVPGGGKSQLVKNTGAEFGIPVINFDLAGMQGSLVGQSGANLRAAQATVDAISGGKILMIATCNSINSLPPELRRRFNLGIFFFDVPTAEERAGIWTIYRKKYSIKASDKTPNDDGWTGAEIKECCKKAYRLKISLEDAAKYIVPVTQSSAEIIENLRRGANGKYLSATNAGPYTYSDMHEQQELNATAPGRKLKN